MTDRLSERLKTFADAFELYQNESRSLTVAFENDRLTEIRQGESSGVSVRAVKQGKIGFSYSSKVDEIDEVAKAAARVAPYGKPYDFEFAKAQKSKVELPYDERCENLSVEKLVELGNKVKETVKSIDKDAMAECSFSGGVGKTRIATSLGQDCEERGSSFGYFVGAKLSQEGNFLQTYRMGDSSSLIEEKRVLDDVRSAAEDLIVAKKIVPFSEGKCRVIFSPAVVSDLMIPIVMSVSGQTIEKKTSRFVNALNEKLFDERLTVIDDPHHPEGSRSGLYDGEGTCTRQRPIIERGVLRGFAHSLSTAKACGHEPTGNASRSVNSVPTPGMHNVVVAPGDKPLKELIKDAEGGLWIDNTLGVFTSNFLAGQVTGNISLGFPVRDGKRTGRVKNCALGVNVFELLRSGIVSISKERQWYGRALLPWIVIDGVSISAR